MELIEFLDRYKDAVTRAVIDTYPPLFDPKTAAMADLGRLRRRPLGGQAEAICAAAFSLRHQQATTIVGEMGVGKSFIGAAAASLAGCRRVLVLCPPHLVRKWEREIRQTVPGAVTTIARSVADLEASRRLAAPFVGIILSRERAKLGPRWQAVTLQRHVFDPGRGRAPRDGDSSDGPPGIVSQLACPQCGVLLADEDGVPLTRADLERKHCHCRACRGALWSVDRTGPRRTPLADYIHRRMRGGFDLLICDEVHEYKARGSAQGIAAAALSGACARTLTLTGTLAGGYSSTLFYLLQRFSPQVRHEFRYQDLDQWIARYGVIERITKLDDAALEDGRTSRRKRYQTRTIERPGITPAALFHLIGNTVFLRLGDVVRDLPPYRERVLTVPLDQTPLVPTGSSGDTPLHRVDGAPALLSQADAYHRLASDLLQAVRAALQGGSKGLLGAYLQALLGWVDNCVRAEVVLDGADGDNVAPVRRNGEPRVIAAAPALPADHLYPKERALLELCQRERQRGRRVLVYLTHTETRDLSPRLVSVLARAHLRTAVLKSATVAPERREEWVAARVKDGAEVLLVHPKLVQTGLDLIDWPSIVFYQPEYSVYVLRQASRRSWRIGQRLPVEVTYLTYERTLQATALALVAAKLRSSLMLEGELPEDGLAALDGDGQDVYLELARKLCQQEMADGAALETILQQAVEFERGADQALVDATASEERAGPGQTGTVTAPAADENLPVLASDAPQPEQVSVLATSKHVSFLELRALLTKQGTRSVRLKRGGPAPDQLSLF